MRARGPLSMLLSLLPGAVLGGALLSAAPAAARDLPCGLVESGTIHVDGLISDWEGVAALELAGSPAPAAGKPLVARVRCNYDDKALYLLVEVQDDIVVRTAAAGALEDHVQVALDLGGRVDRLLLYPNHYQQKLPRRLRWAGGARIGIIEGEGPAGRSKPLKGPPVVEVYDALLAQGYVVELRLPLKALPAGTYRPGAPLPLSVRVVDVDEKAHPQIVSVAETSSMERPEELSRVQFQEVQSALSSLLDDLKADPSDIWWEKTGDIGAGPSRILMIGKALGVIGKEYGWQEVAQARGDIKDVQLVQIGDRLQALAVRTSEAGGGGSREVLRLYRLGAGKGQFQTVFAAEVRKQVGGDVLESQVSYVKRGKAVDLLLTARPPVGFTKDSYQEFPATDVTPILLPWQDKKARFVLGPDGGYHRAP